MQFDPLGNISKHTSYLVTALLSFFMTSHFSCSTAWISKFPTDMQLEVSDIYIETMNEDIYQLRIHFHNPTRTMPLVHKIKGGCAQIGLSSISTEAENVERLGKVSSNTYPIALKKLILTIQASIEHVKQWRSLHKTSFTPHLHDYLIDTNITVLEIGE